MLQQRISIKDNNAEAALFRRRAMVAMAGVILLTLMLLLNLYVVQVIHHDDYQTRSNDNRIKIVPVAPPRGLIFDRNGELLAENRPVFSLEIIPEQVDDLPKMLDDLIVLLKLDPSAKEDFLKEVQRHRRFNPITLPTNSTKSRSPPSRSTSSSTRVPASRPISSVSTHSAIPLPMP